MAWYALYKWFIPWRKTKYVNWIIEYKVYLYDTWFNCLNKESQEEELNRIIERRLKRNSKMEHSLFTIKASTAYMRSRSGGVY